MSNQTYQQYFKKKTGMYNTYKLVNNIFNETSASISLASQKTNSCVGW